MERKHLDLKRDGDWIVASTPDVDRDRDRVMPMGLNLDNYRKNPVLFYGHSYAEPWSLIGKASELEQDSTGLRIRVDLREPASDTDPMHIIRALWDGGLLKAASIGFQPLEAQPNEKGGRDIQRAELMEISLVPIPANQNALRLAAKAMDMADEAPFVTLPQLEEGTPDGETKEAAEEAEQAAPGGDGDAPGTRPQGEAAEEEAVLKADEDKPETQAVIDARFAAILADFVESVRPYLVQS